MEAAVRRRLAALGLAEADYPPLFLASAEERAALIDEAVVPETWFWRDEAPFQFLAQEISTGRLKGQGGRLGLLSLPCASGEEPYSLALSLLASGFPPEAARVVGVDVSTRLLAKAQAARYGGASLRGRGLAWGQAFLEEAGQGLLSPPAQAKAMVRFHPGNLLDLRLLAEEEPWDVVLCRNVLIYLHPQARLRAWANLARLVRPGGLLVVGHAEAGLVPAEEFEPAGPAGAFAFRRRSAPARPGRISRRRPRPRPQPTRSTPLSPPPAPAPQPEGEQEAWLGRVAELADAGRLAEAGAACLTGLARCPDNAQGHFLLGLIALAQGERARAEDCFRRCLYLDPDHHQALVHQALLLKGRGETAQAEILDRRARQAEARARTGEVRP